MLKRIGVERLTIGMYVQELCGSWMDHPFWKESFLINHSEDIQRIVDSSIKDAWIDTSKGLDTDDAQGKAQAEEQIDRTLLLAEECSATEVRKTKLSEELVRAAGIVAKSKQAVVSMFQEARMGNAIQADSVRPLIEDITLSLTRNREALISLA